MLVEAPAGSGKTDLLTRRFLALLAEVEDPGEILAITFTRAAAAEMRNRILGEIEKASQHRGAEEPGDAFSMETLAARAVEHSERMGWRLLDLPAQLRISTIDSFCSEIAMQLPLFSGIGSAPRIEERPQDLYRRAARETLRQIDAGPEPLRIAIEELLRWRDNNWQDLETLLVEMIGKRDLWMHEPFLGRAMDWESLRVRLERPLRQAVRQSLERLAAVLFTLPGAAEEAASLAAFALANGGEELLRPLAEAAGIAAPPLDNAAQTARALDAASALAHLLFTKENGFRARLDKNLGFPPAAKFEKARLLALIARLASVPEVQPALAAVRELPGVGYSEDEWRIVRACFTLLQRAVAELRLVFAETGMVDFTEIGQSALRVLKAEDGQPTDAALAIGGRIRHLLVDEFQDTSRRQFEMLARLVAAWPEPEQRSCFLVGDPKQSIYFFRGADNELFARARDHGLPTDSASPSDAGKLILKTVRLRANFRTAHALVRALHAGFRQVFAGDDGSGVRYGAAVPARRTPGGEDLFGLHLEFVPVSAESAERDAARERQAAALVGVIEHHLPSVEAARQARARGEDAMFRIAVLARTKKHLAPIAALLRERGIRFRAVDTESLAERPEILDAVALARALLDPMDRVAWLGVLRAPWCALSLADLHAVAGGEGSARMPVCALLEENMELLSAEGRAGARRVLDAVSAADAERAGWPERALGTWLRQAWSTVGGPACVDAQARKNLDVLWRLFDAFTGKEPDLFSGALEAELSQITAEPDPEAGEFCGVQLMSIHKSKGLEFEVVLVPALDARAQRNKGGILSWLERGLAEEDESGEVTEFLVAPIQPRGEDSGVTRQWVERAYHAREAQEMRRLLYVAATRAREELHLFAQCTCRQTDAGEWGVDPPAESLLKTAWPALESGIRARLAAWAAAMPAQVDEVRDLAAAAEAPVLRMPRGTLLRRLPPEFEARGPQSLAPVTRERAEAVPALYARHEGGLGSRALGLAVHALLEQLTRLRAEKGMAEACAALRNHLPRVVAQARSMGLDAQAAAALAREALELTLNVAADPMGAWILEPHAGAESEPAWSGIVDGSLRTVRPDRVFQAGVAPCQEGSCLWIVDWKTAHAPDEGQRDLAALRALFAPQLAAYVEFLRRMKGADALVRAGLYYPRLRAFDWWEA